MLLHYDIYFMCFIFVGKGHRREFRDLRYKVVMSLCQNCDQISSLNGSFLSIIIYYTGKITPPPISCDAPTTMTMHTMTSQPMSIMVAYWKISVPIVCFCLACAIVALTITLAYVFIWRK